MAEVVGAELALEPVLGQPARRRHHARVVDQQVDALALPPRARRTRAPTPARRGPGAPPRRRRRAPIASRIAPAAPSPLAVLRQATITVAPARASSRAVTSPSPLLAPVTIAVRPDRSGIWLAVQPRHRRTYPHASDRPGTRSPPRRSRRDQRIAHRHRGRQLTGALGQVVVGQAQRRLGEHLRGLAVAGVSAASPRSHPLAAALAGEPDAEPRLGRAAPPTARRRDPRA